MTPSDPITPTPAATPAPLPPPSPPAAPGLGRLQQLKIDRSAPLRRRRARWPWIVGLLAAAALAAVLLVPRSEPVQLTSVLTSYPSQQYVQLTASGYVVAQRRAAVSSKASGRLIELRVREGSKVQEGELIARLDASDVQASIVAAQAAVRQSQAGLRVAQAAVRQAEVERVNADAELGRVLDLQGQGFVSAQAVDTARRRADAAAVGIASAGAGVAQAQAAVAQAQAQVKVQQVNEAFAEIRAPFDGVVLVKNANVGDIITPFSNAVGTQGAVVTMADMRTLEVEVDVSESNVAKVRPDQPVEITLDALPDKRFRGSVSGIVPTVDRAKATVTTKVRFDQLDPRVLPEMSARVNFLSQPATESDQQPVLAVNPKALVARDGKTAVLRVKDDRAELVPVERGRMLGDAVELRGGVAAGDRLVLSPPASLRAGDKVSVAGS